MRKQLNSSIRRNLTFSMLLIPLLILAGCVQTESEPGQKKEAPKSKTSNSKTSNSSSKMPATPIAAADFPFAADAGEPIFNAETRTIMYHGPNRVGKDAAHFDSKLKELGWTKEPGSEIVDGVAFLDYKNGKLNITITLNPASDGSSMATMAQGSGILVPEESDTD